MQIHAPMQMNLTLSIPLKSDSKNTTHVQGQVTFNNGVLTLPYGDYNYQN